MNKDSLLIAIFGLSFGYPLVLLLSDIEPEIHLLHQPYSGVYATMITLLVIIPIVEEISKYVVAKFKIFLDEKNQLYQALAVGYGFQIAEAFYYRGYESTWYIRLFLPLHIFFTFVASRYSLPFAILLHGIWNSRIFIQNDGIIYPAFTAIYYLLFFSLLYIDRINKVELDESFNINKTANIHKINKT